MNLLIVIPFHADNAAQTEKLLDFMYRQGRIASGHILLAASADVHGEMRKRIKISAELCFAGVHELDLRPLTDPQSTKVAQVNNAFRQTAQYIADEFTWPFFWMEPDCVPTDGTSLRRLSVEYFSQPKSFLGTQMRVVSTEKEEKFFMARNGIYPNQSFSKIFMADVPRGPFEIFAGEVVNSRLTPTKLIQQIVINSEFDLARVRADAIFVHGDKNGHFMRSLESKLSKPAIASLESRVELVESVKPSLPIAIAPDPVPEAQPVRVDHDPGSPLPPRRRGRPSKADIALRVANVQKMLNGNV